MNIFDIIKNDHRKVLDIMDQLDETTTRAAKKRQQLFTKLKDEILPHMQAEESLFYSLLLDEGSDRDLVFQALEEHKAARSVMHDVDETSFEDEQWHGKFKVMAELVEHHIDEEEDEVFDMADEIIDDERADELGERFQSMKKESKATV